MNPRGLATYTVPMSLSTITRAVWRSLATAWTTEPHGPVWAPWAWTMVLNTGIAVLITVLSPTRAGLFGENFIVSQCIGLVIHGLFTGIGHLLSIEMFEMPAGLRLLYVMAVVLAGSWIGFALGMLLVLRDGAQVAAMLGRASGSLIAMPLIYATLMVVLFTGVGRWRARQLAAARVQGEHLRAERELIAARLALLNAQIEPHFLYNTLAHVRALTVRDPVAAQRMIDALIEYLRAASRSLSRSLIPLREEIDSVRGYLGVMQQRLGDRLRVEWAVPAPAMAVPVPPAALQTLVENAIKHGIEPSSEGGVIRISARECAAAWEVDVSNTGVGFESPARTASSGTGLVNLRERLRLALGPQATLVLEREEPWTRARLHLVAPVAAALPTTTGGER